MAQKNELMQTYIRNGVTSLDDMRSHFNSFAEGGLTNPDWDPDNPYHYHNANGEKVVITPEDWERHKGQPYFKQVEDTVLAEQAAHPGPEYIINPQFSEDLRRVYKGNMGPKYQNYSSFSGNLPQGYSFTSEGLVQDNQGNLYVQKGFRQTPRFTYNESNPLTLPVLEGRNQGNVTFYPVNMEKTIKPSLSVNSIMNVDKEHESAIKKAQNQYEYAISPVFDLMPTYLMDQKYGEISYITDIIGRAVNTSDPYEDIIVSPAEFALIKSKYKKDLNKDVVRSINEHPEWDNSFYWELVNQDNPWMWQDPDGTYTDSSPKPRKISRKAAEKKAVIEVGPLQVDKIETFGNGGYLFATGGPKKVKDNNLYETHPELFTAYHVNVPLRLPDEMAASALLEEKRNQANSLASDFVLKEGIENTMNSPYYNNKLDRWTPQKSVEGGADTIGKGLKLNNTNANWYKILQKQGYLTNTQMEEGVKEMTSGFYDKAKNTYSKKYGEYAWDTLAPEKQSLLMDYVYNGVLDKFPAFMQAVHDNDRDSILNEYKRHAGKKELKTRNIETLKLINDIWPE